MPIRDFLLDFGQGAAIAITGFTTAAKKGYSLYTGGLGKNAFGGTEAYRIPEGWGLNVTCAATMDTAATLTFDLRTSTLDAGTGGTTTSLGTQALTSVTLNAGDAGCFIAADPMAVMQDYLVLFITSTASLSTGSIYAWIGPPQETPIAPTNLKK